MGDVPVGVCIGFEQGAGRCGIYRSGRSFRGECVEVCGEAAVEAVAEVFERYSCLNIEVRVEEQLVVKRGECLGFGLL